MDVNRRRIGTGWMVGLLMLALPAWASTPVHKCGLPDGRTVYQSAECARGQRTLARWRAAPDPVLAATARPRRPASTSQREARARGRAHAAVGSDPCRDARERRDAIEREAGLSRTYDLLSALQRDVYEACR